MPTPPPYPADDEWSTYDEWEQRDADADEPDDATDSIDT